jgi:hypothetical protein|tara:strand:+ start:401 stop:1234 length:834 start_codon:yes stop_codon:yes gene_type:complete
MSNQLATLMGASDLVELGLDADTLAVAGGATKGNKRISIDGRAFRKFVGGKEVSVNTDISMNVIFVKMAHEASRTFYNQQYKKGVKLSPACWSNDSKTPDPEVTSPCASACAECPNSVKGSGQGGTGTACRLSWRTAVVLPNDPDGDVYQLVLPATSAFGKEENGRWPFRPYVQMLANNNVSAGRVITKMEFDVNSSVPRLLFSPVSAVPTESRDAIVRQSKTPAAESAIKLTVYKTDTPDEEVAQPVAEPVKRETRKATAETADDVSDIVKKWTKK